MKPTLDDVLGYIIGEGYSVDPDEFYDYYEAHDWISGGRVIHNWHALVDAWQRRGEGICDDDGAESERKRKRSAYLTLKSESYFDACEAYAVFDPSATLKIPPEFLDGYTMAKLRGEKSFIWNSKEVKVNYGTKQ